MLPDDHDPTLVVHRATRRSKRDKMGSPSNAARLVINRDEFFHDDDDDDDNLTIGTEWFTKSTITDGGHPSDEILPLEGEDRSPSSSLGVINHQHHQVERREPHSHDAYRRSTTTSAASSETMAGKDSSELVVVEELMIELDSTKEQLSLALANNAKKACRIHELEQEMETLHTKWKTTSKQRNDFVIKLQGTLGQVQEENLKLKYENRALRGRLGHMIATTASSAGEVLAAGGSSPTSVGESSTGSTNRSTERREQGGYPGLTLSSPSAFSAHGRLQKNATSRNDQDIMRMIASTSASMGEGRNYYADDNKRCLASPMSPSSFTSEREESDSMSASLKLVKTKKKHSPSKNSQSSPTFPNERGGGGSHGRQKKSYCGIGISTSGASPSASRRPTWRKVLSKHKKKEEVRPLLSTTQKLERKEAQKLANMGCFPDYWQCLPHVHK